MKKKKNKYNISAMRGNAKISIQDLDKKAIECLKDENFEEALMYYQQLEKYDADFDYYYFLGICYYNTSNYKKATEYLKREYDLLLLQIQNPEDYEDFNEDEVFEDIQYCFDKICRSYEYLDEFEKCIDFCNEITKENKLYKYAVLYLTECYNLINNDEKFNEYYSILKDNYWDDISLKKDMLIHFIALKNIKAFELIEELKNENIELAFYAVFFKMFIESEDYEKNIIYAEYAYKTIISNNYKVDDSKHEYDNFFIISERLFKSLYKTNNWEKIAYYFEIIKKIRANDDDDIQFISYPLCYYVLTGIKNNKLDECEKTIKEILNIDEKAYYIAYVYLGIVYYFKKDYEKALEYWNKPFISNETELNTDYLSDYILYFMNLKKNNNMIEDLKEKEEILFNTIKSNEVTEESVLLNQLFMYVYKTTNEIEKFEKCSLYSNETAEKIYYEDIFSIPLDENILDNLIINSLALSEIKAN